MFGLGVGELALIVGAIVLMFGAKKLPSLGGAIGESIKNFKKGVKDPDALPEGESKTAAKTDSEGEKKV